MHSFMLPQSEGHSGTKADSRPAFMELPFQDTCALWASFSPSVMGVLNSIWFPKVWCEEGIFK